MSEFGFPVEFIT
jgi:hypothetical protein